MHALIIAGTVWQTFDSDPMLGPSFDVRDVSSIKGIAQGWTENKDGSYSAPKLPEPGGGSSQAPSLTYKADLYRRCTDAEAEAIEVALAAAPVRERRLFESAQYLDHAAPEFATLQEHLIQMFGQDRADALLAAS